MKGKALIWMCKKCRWISISDQYPHQMQFCKCWDDTGRSNDGVAVDNEVHYMRIVGNIKNYLPMITVDLDKCTFKRINNK